MRKLQFTERSVSFIENNPQFVMAHLEPAGVQRTMLTMLINRIFTLGPFIVPAEIRLSLSMSTDSLGWSDDLKLVILPFLKANEDHFFH
jgi:hypothetical protein